LATAPTPVATNRHRTNGNLAPRPHDW